MPFLLHEILISKFEKYIKEVTISSNYCKLVLMILWIQLSPENTICMHCWAWCHL